MGTAVAAVLLQRISTMGTRAENKLKQQVNDSHTLLLCSALSVYCADELATSLSSGGY